MILATHGIVKNPTSYISRGLIFYVDAGKSSSYPGTGSTWYNLGTSGNNATLVNSPTHTSGSGGYFTLNGTNQKATATQSSISTYTISIWLNSSNISGAIYYVFSGTNTASGIFFGGAAVGNNWGFYNGAVLYGSVITTGTWYNVTVAKTGTSYKLYTNGVLTTDTTGVDLSMNTINIGVRGDGSWYFNGKYAIAMVHDVALTDTEILANFNFFKGRYGL